MAVFKRPFAASPLPEIKEIPSDTPPHDAVPLTRYRAAIDGKIRTLCVDYDGEVYGYIGDSGRFTPPLDMASGQDKDKGGREPCRCEMYGYCACSIVVGAINASCLIRPCAHGCMVGCPCQTCAGRKLVRISRQGEIWAFKESVIAWVDDDRDVRIRRATTDPIKLKIALPYDHLAYRPADASYHCNRCHANIVPFLRVDELEYVGADTHGVPYFHDCPNCGLEAGGIIGGMADFTDDASAPPLAAWDGVRTNRPRVEKSEARVWERKNERRCINGTTSIEFGHDSTPAVFISYSRWDGDDHTNRVRDLVYRLRSNRVNVAFDENVADGDGDILKHSESILAHEFVLVICSPSYKERYEKRDGGVGVEGRIISNAVMQNRLQLDRVLSVSLAGDFNDEPVLETLAGMYVFDLSDDNPDREKEYESLLRRVSNLQS